MKRRQFIKRVGATGASVALTSWPVWAQNSKEPLRFGVITDVHKDIMHDANERLTAFIQAMNEAKVDFIVQLGDFCVPKEANQSFLDIWNGFQGPRYHVLGNHDTDGGFSRGQTVAWWKMPSRYYAFEQSGIKFIVLDGNDRPENHAGGYPRFIAEDQQQWLSAELEETDLPVIVFVHQSLEREDNGGVQNGGEVREILEKANARAGKRQVIACFSGHHHRDYVRTIHDISYPQINSASYFWVGGDFQHIRYSEQVDEEHPYIKYTVPYKEPLFGIVTIDRVQGTMSMQGRRSSFVGPSPWDLGQDRAYWDADTLTADVSDWSLKV
jgi:predicted phosphodiesterase